MAYCVHSLLNHTVAQAKNLDTPFNSWIKTGGWNFLHASLLCLWRSWPHAMCGNTLWFSYLWACHRHSKSTYSPVTGKNSFSPGSLFSSVQSRWGVWREKDSLFLLCKMIYAQTFITHMHPSPHKDYFPWLHLTTGTILSVGSLTQSDWIHCSAILMDVLWSFLFLDSHLNPVFNLRGEFHPKSAAPLSLGS